MAPPGEIHPSLLKLNQWINNPPCAGCGSKNHTSRHSRAFLPGCTHHTMTRTYRKGLVCCECDRENGLGYVYICSQDIEIALQNDVSLAREVAVDTLCRDLKIPSDPTNWSRSPAARADVDQSLTNETYHDKGYTDELIGVLMSQRDNVIVKAKQDSVLQEVKKDLQDDDREPGTLPRVLRDAGDADQSKPWLVREEDECGYMVCPACANAKAGETSFLSTDAVLKGEIPMTAAIGLGFQDAGQRPVMLKKHAMNFDRDNNVAPTTPIPWLIDGEPSEPQQIFHKGSPVNVPTLEVRQQTVQQRRLEEGHTTYVPDTERCQLRGGFAEVHSDRSQSPIQHSTPLTGQPFTPRHYPLYPGYSGSQQSPLQLSHSAPGRFGELSAGSLLFSPHPSALQTEQGRSPFNFGQYPPGFLGSPPQGQPPALGVNASYPPGHPRFAPTVQDGFVGYLSDHASFQRGTPAEIDSDGHIFSPVVDTPRMTGSGTAFHDEALQIAKSATISTSAVSGSMTGSSDSVTPLQGLKMLLDMKYPGYEVDSHIMEVFLMCHRGLYLEAFEGLYHVIDEVKSGLAPGDLSNVLRKRDTSTLPHKEVSFTSTATSSGGSESSASGAKDLPITATIQRNTERLLFAKAKELLDVEVNNYMILNLNETVDYAKAKTLGLPLPQLYLRPELDYEHLLRVGYSKARELMNETHAQGVQETQEQRRSSDNRRNDLPVDVDGHGAAVTGHTARVNARFHADENYASVSGVGSIDRSFAELRYAGGERVTSPYRATTRNAGGNYKQQLTLVEVRRTGAKQPADTDIADRIVNVLIQAPDTGRVRPSSYKFSNYDSRLHEKDAARFVDDNHGLNMDQVMSFSIDAITIKQNMDDPRFHVPDQTRYNDTQGFFHWMRFEKERTAGEEDEDARSDSIVTVRGNGAPR